MPGRVRSPLDKITDLTGVAVLADRMHTQREHAPICVIAAPSTRCRSAGTSPPYSTGSTP
jgi:hypothetical protein